MKEKNEIFSAYEDFDRVILEFSQQLQNFRNNMAEEVFEINDIVNNMSKSWRGVAYNDFKRTIERGTGNISESLEDCGKVADTLKQISAELNRELELLRRKA